MKFKPNALSGREASAAETSAANAPPAKAGLAVRLKQILVAIDFSAGSLRALDYAIGLAAPLTAKLTLLHIVEPAVHQEAYLGVPPPIDDTNQNLIKAGHERLAALGKKRVGTRVPAAVLVRMGRAHSEIADTAKALGADLIVIGTTGYTGLKNVLLGGTAERILRDAPCPVLTVRSGTVATGKSDSVAAW